MARFWEDGSGHNGTCRSMRTMLQFLGQPCPLELLELLTESELDVTHMAVQLELEGTLVSRTLKALHGYSLVEVKRVGTRHVYRLGPGASIRRSRAGLVLRVATADGAIISLRVPERRVKTG